MNREVGKSLRSFVQSRGITQAALVEAAGCSQVYISYVLSGKRNLTLEMAKNISDEYGVSIDLLIGNVGGENRAMPKKVNLCFCCRS